MERNPHGETSDLELSQVVNEIESLRQEIDTLKIGTTTGDGMRLNGRNKK
jgi:hypothetical protein